MVAFLRDLEKTARQNNSWLCVGLDPDGTVGDTFDFNQRIISATLDLVCCYKINTAFYEARGPSGIEALIKTVQYIKAVSYTHLRAHETDSYLVCRLLLEKKKKKTQFSK